MPKPKPKSFIPDEFAHLPYRNLFELGFNTLEIAARKKVDEADVYNALARERGFTLYSSRLGASFLRYAATSSWELGTKTKEDNGK